MSTLNQVGRRIGVLGTSLALILVVAGAGKVSAQDLMYQEIYKVSASLSHGSASTKIVSMDSTLAFPTREPLGASLGAPDLQAPMFDRPALPEGGSGVVKETRESILEQIAAHGLAFGKWVKAASSRCTGWQIGGFDQPWIGPDRMMERACVFQFELPTK